MSSALIFLLKLIPDWLPLLERSRYRQAFFIDQ